MLYSRCSLSYVHGKLFTDLFFSCFTVNRSANGVRHFLNWASALPAGYGCVLTLSIAFTKLWSRSYRMQAMVATRSLKNTGGVLPVFTTAFSRRLTDSRRLFVLSPKVTFSCCQHRTHSQRHLCQLASKYLTTLAGIEMVAQAIILYISCCMCQGLHGSQC